MTGAPEAKARRALSDPPGGVLLWLVVGLELLTFGIVFVLVAVERSGDPALFAAGQAALDIRFGLGLTVLLVTSGALAAQAVHRYRRADAAGARRLFLGAGALGVGFVAVKLADYAKHASLGHGLGASGFWDAYLLATGFHFLHVLVGLALLFGVAARVGRANFTDAETAIVGSALFWHLCDVAWFFLFPIFFVKA